MRRMARSIAPSLGRSGALDRAVDILGVRPVDVAADRLEAAWKHAVPLDKPAEVASAHGEHCDIVKRRSELGHAVAARRQVYCNRGPHL
jgi:hypothetical protein